MTGTEPEGFGDEVLARVLPGEVDDIVAAYRQARDAEKVVRQLLGRCGVVVDDAHPVASLDHRCRPVVRLTLSASDCCKVAELVDVAVRRSAERAGPR